jgi:NAD(P)-dependent dehydrogenase (short-subunit alcohol dehydrogenase family)
MGAPPTGEGRGAMTDQHEPRDPTEQYRQDLPGEQLEHPGLEADMRVAPDFGEATYRGSGRLEGRRAVITGGDSGIGRAVALAFAREGADVALSFLPEEEEDGRETARVVQEAGRRALLLPGDLQDEAYCRELVDRTAQELGGLDVLVNNAAFQMAHAGLEDLASEEIERTFRVNIISMFHTSRAALAHMQPGASIINTTSIQAYQPAPMLLAYAATKAAIVNFTANLAQSVVERGIRVNAVAPGPVWTPLIPATMPEDKVEGFGEGESPTGRAAQPAELAPPYVFLASQESSYVNGETIRVTGGVPVF